MFGMRSGLVIVSRTTIQVQRTAKVLRRKSAQFSGGPGCAASGGGRATGEGSWSAWRALVRISGFFLRGRKPLGLSTVM